MKNENNNLLQQNVQLSEAEKENEALRAQLGFQQKSTFKTVPAEVIAKDPTDIQKIFEISVGKKQGIKNGMPVISSGFLIGKISEVHYNTSKVLLITNPNSIINGILQKSRTYGLVYGEIGFGLTMNSIPQGVQINIGDIVVTSGLGGDFPKGLILGKVSGIISKQGEMFQTAKLSSMIDFAKLETVFVIIGDK